MWNYGSLLECSHCERIYSQQTCRSEPSVEVCSGEMAGRRASPVTCHRNESWGTKKWQNQKKNPNSYPIVFDRKNIGKQAKPLIDVRKYDYMGPQYLQRAHRRSASILQVLLNPPGPSASIEQPSFPHSDSNWFASSSLNWTCRSPSHSSNVATFPLRSASVMSLMTAEALSMLSGMLVLKRFWMMLKRVWREFASSIGWSVVSNRISSSSSLLPSFPSIISPISKFKPSSKTDGKSTGNLSDLLARDCNFCHKPSDKVTWGAPLS